MCTHESAAQFDDLDLERGTTLEPAKITFSIFHQGPEITSRQNIVSHCLKYGYYLPMK